MEFAMLSVYCRICGRVHNLCGTKKKQTCIKTYQLCFLDSHNDECGPTSASDPNNYGDAGGNDDHNMLWAGQEVDAIGTGITWDFAIR